MPLIVTGSVSFSTTINVRGEQINQLDFAGYEHDPSLPNLWTRQLYPLHYSLTSKNRAHLFANFERQALRWG